MGKYVHIRSFSLSLSLSVVCVCQCLNVFSRASNKRAERKKRKKRKTNCSSALPRMLVLVADGTDACHHNTSVNSTITTKVERSSLPSCSRVPSTMLLHNHSVKYVQDIFFVHREIRVLLLLEHEIQSSFNTLLQSLFFSF